MKSKVVKVGGKLFRYDFDDAVVEYVHKATKAELKEEAEWIEEHGSPLIGYDKDGYTVLESAGLRRENWKNKAVRDEYLDEWSRELEAEADAMMADFIKFELPILQKEAAER